MKKALMALLVFYFISIIFICGCSEQQNDGYNINAIVMTAKELKNDQETIQGDTITINYKSLNGGDNLIINDTIFKINYDYIYNKTIVLFVWEEENSSDSMMFEFEGDITGSFFNNEQVKIKVKIKHIVFSYQNVTHDMELFEQQWVNEEYFNSYRYKPLPQSCISKE